MLLDLPDNLALALLASGVGRRAVDDALGEDAPAAPADDDWLDEADSAALINSDPERLRAHRRDHTGPEYERFGRTRRFIRYRRSAVLAWAKRNPGRLSGRDDIDPEGDGA